MTLPAGGGSTSSKRHFQLGWTLTEPVPIYRDEVPVVQKRDNIKTGWIDAVDI